MLKRENGVRKATESYRTYSSLVQLQPWFPSLRLKTCLWAELQPWCLSFAVKDLPLRRTHDYIYIGRRVIGISGSLFWSETLMELIFNPCGEFVWSTEGPVSQIHSPHLLVGAPGIFSDLLSSVQMLKGEWCAENNGKLPHLFIPSKTATFVP